MADRSERQSPAGTLGDGPIRPRAGWRRVAVPVALIALLGPGCTTVQSTREPNFAASQPTGLTYFLPTRPARLTVTRTPADLDGLTSKRDQKAAALAGATAQATVAKTRREQAEAVLAAMLATAATRPDRVQPTNLLDAQHAVQVALAQETSRAAAVQALSAQVDGLEREIAIAGTANGACQYSVRLELLPPQADRSARFVAQLPHNYLRDDTVRLDVNPAGLLTSANVVAVDQTGQVLVALAGVLGSVAGAGFRLNSLAFGGQDPQPICSGPSSLVRIFDPASAAEVTALDRLLKQREFPFDIDVHLQGEGVVDGGRRNLPLAQTPASGLYYRSPTPVLIELRRFSVKPDPNEDTDRPGSTLTDPKIDDPPPIYADVLMLPQAGPVSYLPMRASAFVKTTSDVQFVDGSVASWASERPSEVLSVARLPAQAIEAFSGALARVLTLRVETSAGRQALATQQIDEFVDQERYRLLQACLARAGQDTSPCLPDAE